ncbi:hypothetical protein V5799_030287 [Amblyomma americanum]|uniref:Lipocalin n=1 Tax=Amblyomma americanum TaxID=6943 RepID=A0AAQ4ENU2_AMBAM
MLVIGSMAGPRPPYEEDSTHFDEQEIQNFLKLSGKLYVRMRNYKQGTNFKCHYVEKVGAEGEHSYVYTLKARNGSGYFGNNLTVTPTRTGDHEKNNALQYTTPNSDQVIVKLMAKDTENSCFIFVRNTTESRSRKGKCSLATLC